MFILEGFRGVEFRWKNGLNNKLYDLDKVREG